MRSAVIKATTLSFSPPWPTGNVRKWRIGPRSVWPLICAVSSVLPAESHLIVEEKVLAVLASDRPDKSARQDAAPRDLAAVHRLVRRRLLSKGEQMTARHRPYAVGADDDVRLERRAVGKAELIGVGDARDVDELLAGVQLSRVERIAENVQQLRAGDLADQRVS